MGGKINHGIIPTKGWVTSSYFNGNNSSELYALDPDLGNTRLDINPEPILREHYGCWLQIMGLDRAGLALRYGEIIPTRVRIEFEIKEIDGYEFAFPSRMEHLLFIPSRVLEPLHTRRGIRVGMLLRTLE